MRLTLDMQTFNFEEYHLDRIADAPIKRLAGLYLFKANNDKVLYIGTSANLYQRVVSHDKLNLIRNLGCNVVGCYYASWDRSGDTIERRKRREELEQQLIKKYSPPLNRQHKRRYRTTDGQLLEVLVDDYLLANLKLQAKARGLCLNDLILEKLCN